MKEKQEQTIELHGLTAETMDILLNCIYSEPFSFTIENVQEILPVIEIIINLNVHFDHFIKQKYIILKGCCLTPIDRYSPRL